MSLFIRAFPKLAFHSNQLSASFVVALVSTFPSSNMAAVAPPPTQRCVLLTGYGEFDNILHFTTSHPAPPPPPPEHIRVRVHAASINPIDWKQARGKLRLFLHPAIPHIPGRDLSGVVVAVGSGVSRLAVGDAVMAVWEDGAYGEYVNVKESYVAKKPANLSFAEAATLPLAAQTVLEGFERANVQPGQRVVVIGASGGCGLFAVQMAKRVFGASEVVAVASGRNAELVRSAGADVVVDYTRQRLSEAVAADKYDVVFDCVGGDANWTEGSALLKPRGQYVGIVGRSNGGYASVSAFLGTVAKSTWRLVTGMFDSSRPVYHTFFLQPSYSKLERISLWAAEGKLTVHIDRRYEFSKQGVREMYQYASEGRTRGKLVLNIVQEEPK